MASKGKGIAGKDSSGKRKRGDNDKAGNGGQKKRNRDVLQFFEDAAVEFDPESSDDSDEFDDIEDFIDDIDVEPNVKSEPGKFESARVFPKEEELSGDELEKMLQDRYGSGSGCVRYAEDDYDSKRAVDRGFFLRSVAEPTIWKVKCKVGREKHTVFCLMQKYVDLKELGTRLQIITAFVVEHIKGFVFVEAEKQSDVIEACHQLADVYYSLVTRVPINEVSQLLVVRRRYNEVKEGTWARVKNGIYRGDIAQVVAVNNERKRATVKLIPRIDLQALAGKYGGGAVVKKSKSVLPARLITARELEEFQPLMQCRRDRDTGKVFEFLDNLMLKDGFLYKKVSFDSLSFWDINPSEDELLKFAPPSTDASDNLEWLSQLYGEQKKEHNMTLTKGGGKGEGASGCGGGKGEGTSGGSGGGKGEGTSGSNEQSSFAVHDLVLFGKRDFGMIVGMEKDDNCKVLKNGPDGPLMMTLGHKDLKYVPLDRKFTALDRRMKTISISDTVSITDGPAKGRQGIVKQIYRGIIFLYDEHDLDNAYFCANSQMSEKAKHPEFACQGKDGDGPSGFEDVPSSPKSPLSPKKPWQMRENNPDGDRRNNDEMFSVGQSLRIRVGPLKGYLCRVLAVRRSDVTVKLDSQQKVLTVKREHLSEVRAKISGTSMSDDTGLSSAFKPFDLLGTEGCSNDWLQGASGSADGSGWNVGVASSNERGAWPTFSSSGASLQVGTSAAGGPTSVDNDSKKEDDAWLSKVVDQKISSWGAAGNEKVVGNSCQAGGWAKSDGDWGKSAGNGASSSWENANIAGGNHGSSWKAWGSNSDQRKEGTLGQADAWGEGKKFMEKNSWGKQSSEEGDPNPWNKGKGAEEASGWNVNGSCGSAGPSGWGKWKAGKDSQTWGVGTQSVGLAAEKAGDAWGKAKESGNPVADGWVKGAGSWENKNASNECSKWKSSAAALESEAVRGAQVQGQNSSGGWKKSSLAEHSNENWSKEEGASGWSQERAISQGGSSWNKSGGCDCWDKSGGRTGDRNHGGCDQYHKGRGGGSFGREQFSSWSKENESGSSWGNSSDGNGDQGSDWGNKNSVSERRGKAWCKSRESGETSWGLVRGTSAGNPSSDDGACGRDSWAVAQDKSDLTKDSYGKGPVTWGNKNSSDKSSGWKSSGAGAAPEPLAGWSKTQEENASGGRKNNSWNDSLNGNWDKQETASDWGKGGTPSQGGSSWNKSGGNAWGGANDKSDVAKDLCGNKNSFDESCGWKSSKTASESQAGGWGQAQEENVSGGWKSSKTASESQAGGWGQAQEENTSGGWKSNNWNDRSNGNWGKQENSSDWRKGGATSEAESSWHKSGGFGSWDKSSDAVNDQGYGSRGSGGRRGRDGNRGGRSQFGRGRGGSFGQGQFSNWSKENQSENDQGYGGRGSRGRRVRGGNNWGRDQFGRGRGNSFGQGQSSSWSKENQGGSSWSCGSGGNGDQRSDWGNRKDWNSDSTAEEKGWCKSRESNETSSWSLPKEDASWPNKVNDNQNSSWGASSNVKAAGKSSTGDGSWVKSSGGGASSSWESADRDGKSSGNSDPGDGGWGKSCGGGASGTWGSANRNRSSGDGNTCESFGNSNPSDSGWGKSSGGGASSTWGSASCDGNSNTGDGGWGKSSGGGVSSGWGSANHDGKSSGNSNAGAAGWGGSCGGIEKIDSWGNQSAEKGLDSWDKGKVAGEASHQD